MAPKSPSGSEARSEVFMAKPEALRIVLTTPKKKCCSEPHYARFVFKKLNELEQWIVLDTWVDFELRTGEELEFDEICYFGPIRPKSFGWSLAQLKITLYVFSLTK